MYLASGEGKVSKYALLIPEVPEIVWSAGFILIFAFAFMKFVLPKMNEVLDERAAKIEGGIRKAEEAQYEADRLKAMQESELAAARREAAEMREKAREEGARIIEEARTRASLETERMIGLGKQQIEAEQAQASAELRGEVGSLASTLASKIVGESLTDDERSRRVIDRFLDELESSTAAK
ncbi:MAG: F0F1 ATP synthase subunit B [Dermabacter sp.]|nr:F0F1 ATP synthase subunit B [Dermabacter sp.]